MFITLGQAAKQLGVSKSTLSKYLREGKLSGQKQPDGSYRIDPAELDRVRTVLRPHPEPSAEHSDTPVDIWLIQHELDRLRDLLVERERTLAERDRRIEDLVRERDRWAALAERLLAEPPRQISAGNNPWPRVWSWFWGKRHPVE